MDVVVAEADALVVSFFWYKADSEEPGDEGIREGGDGLKLSFSSLCCLLESSRISFFTDDDGAVGVVGVCNRTRSESRSCSFKAVFWLVISASPLTYYYNQNY